MRCSIFKDYSRRVCSRAARRLPSSLTEGNWKASSCVTGDKEILAKLRVDDEFVHMIVGVQLVHSKVGVVRAYTGAEMQSLFRMWSAENRSRRNGGATLL